METLKNIIHSFDAISLQDMEESALLNRTDTKFVFSRDQLYDVLPALRDDYDMLEVARTRINHYKTLYFDTPAYDFYHMHHNGKNGRYKVRIRNYVDSGLYFLETKYKFKGRTIKSRLPIGQFEHELSPSSERFLEQSMKNDYQKIKAQLWNDFNRITLSNKKSEERLTIDINLDFSWAGKQIVFKDYVIAELKQPRINYRSPFYKAMKTMRIRPMSMSKYCIGLIFMRAALGDPIKSNTFKSRILKLNKIENARVD